MFALHPRGGIGGGLMTVILHAIFPTAGPFGGIVHGASGAVLAIMAGVGFLYPHKTIALLFIGVVRLIHVVFAFIFLDILFLAAGGTSVSAHWGGVLTGFLWAKSAKWGLDLSGWAGIFYPNRMPRESLLERLESIFAAREQKKKKGRTAGSGGMPGVTVTERESRPRHAAPAAAASTQPDVDAILDKISEEGYDALTSEEKRILYEASKRD